LSIWSSQIVQHIGSEGYFCTPRTGASLTVTRMVILHILSTALVRVFPETTSDCGNIVTRTRSDGYNRNFGSFIRCIV